MAGARGVRSWVAVGDECMAVGVVGRGSIRDPNTTLPQRQPSFPARLPLPTPLPPPPHTQTHTTTTTQANGLPGATYVAGGQARRGWRGVIHRQGGRPAILKGPRPGSRHRWGRHKHKKSRTRPGAADAASPTLRPQHRHYPRAACAAHAHPRTPSVLTVTRCTAGDDGLEPPALLAPAPAPLLEST
jgi:hypothetical protein